MYVSHITDDGKMEDVQNHLDEVAQMASEFARSFGAENWAQLAGAFHDIGKCSEAFQNRILNNGPIIDHSTAGAFELFKQTGISSLAFCVAGHHGGLPDGGSNFDTSDDATLSGRIKRVEEGNIPPYSIPTGTELPKNLQFAFSGNGRPDEFSFAFLTRMVFSCLVDADYLCTERFMLGKERESLGSDSLDKLARMLEEKLAGFYPPKTPLNRIRCKVLDACAEKAAEAPGLFSLTVPTGGGKTYASLRFALQHATTSNHAMQRVIYAVPYTSIISQNAKVFRNVLGEANVLEHHANFDFDNASDNDGFNQQLRLASENWDAPVIVTTNVQLFESLFANKTSRCRKLHNIANSVIVLDEAQMLPTAYLEPCVRALTELVWHYGCSVVLCTATQPALSGLFEKHGLEVHEIAPDIEETFAALRRVTYNTEKQLTDDELAEKMLATNQVLTVLNSRKQTCALHDIIIEKSGSHEGIFHLSTRMHPAHRDKILSQVRQRLHDGLSCHLVSTSLIEAGVDVDFPTVYRALAGIDSIVQCAGRCNREGKHSAEESIVHVFEAISDSGAPYNIPNDVQHKAELARNVMRWQQEYSETAGSNDYGSLAIIESYFAHLLKQATSLDEKDVCRKLGKWGILRNGIPSIPFLEVAESFNFIEENTNTVIIPDSSIASEIDLLREGKASRSSLRKIARFGVNVYENEIKELRSAGAVELVKENIYLLLDESLYRNDVGLDTSDAGGKGLFF